MSLLAIVLVLIFLPVVLIICSLILYVITGAWVFLFALLGFKWARDKFKGF